MKIIDWFKNLLKKTSRKDYMLSDVNSSVNNSKSNKDFVTKIDVNGIKTEKTREDILKSLREDIIVEDLSEEYNYSKFSDEYIKDNYDSNSILSDEDKTALSCLYGAIKNGNSELFLHNGMKYDDNSKLLSDNKINNFLKQNPNNIVVLINLMIQDAQNMYNSLTDDSLSSKTSVQGLISGSYTEISEIIERYNKEHEIEIG